MKLSETEARQLVAPLGIDLPKSERKPKRKPPAEPDPKPHQIAFLALCQGHGLPAPIPEFYFHPERKWHFDWLFEGWLAVEQVGGVWIRGHHSRGQTQIDDMARRNEAQIMGYVVLEFTPEQMNSGEACATIKRALGSEDQA